MITSETEDIALADGERTPQSVELSLDSHSASCKEDEEGFFKRFVDGEEFIWPLNSLADDLKDFHAKKGKYSPKKHLPFAEDVLLGIPDNGIYSYEPSRRLGLTAELDDCAIVPEEGARPVILIPLTLEHYLHPEPKLVTAKSCRIGGEEVTCEKPFMISDSGQHFYRKFVTRGRVVPLINEKFFLKRRMGQDLTAVINEEFKSMPEDKIPHIISVKTASEILDTHLAKFISQVDRRNDLDQLEATVDGFMPVSRLETNVIEKEIQRRENISKRPPELSAEAKKQLDRKKKNIADYRARKRAEKELVLPKSKLL